MEVPMRARILLIEDESALVTILTDLLRAEGYAVETAADGRTGLRRALDGAFDLIILDLMLPAVDGLEVCDTLRQEGFDGAVLMLTAKSQVADRVRGLRIGADDYVTKPFDSTELLARISALLRRVHKEQLTPVMRFRFGGVAVDFAKPEVCRDGEPISLAAKELQLLRYLIDHRGEVLSRERLLQTVWRLQPFITPRTVDTHIAWLRQKLEDNPQLPRHILTVRGEGYRFQS
jgi:two-component system, OmpR family, alkaline phosphatase synthesis response regulator PhoP